MNLADLQHQIEQYRPIGASEVKEKEIVLSLLKSCCGLLTRDNETAHFTASALILNEERNKTLMIYHNIYDSWSWTGGHADGEADLLAVAVREAEEETGAEARPVFSDILSLDILPVWGHIKNGRYVASHLHLNLTYLLEVKENSSVRVKPDENSGVRWFPLSEMAEAAREEPMKPIYRKLVERARLF